MECSIAHLLIEHSVTLALLSPHPLGSPGQKTKPLWNLGFEEGLMGVKHSAECGWECEKNMADALAQVRSRGRRES